MSGEEEIIYVPRYISITNHTATETMGGGHCVPDGRRYISITNHTATETELTIQSHRLFEGATSV